MTAEGAADFFSQLGQKEQKAPKQPEPAKPANDFQPESETAGSGGQRIVQETISRNTNWDEGAEGIIK